MKDPEQNLIFGSVQLSTPEGPIQLFLSISVGEQSAELAKRYLPCESLGELTKTIAKTFVLEDQRSKRAEERSAHRKYLRQLYPIYALIPDEEFTPHTIKMLVILIRQRDIKTPEELASLPDEDLTPGTFRQVATKGYETMHRLRDLARKHLEESVAQNRGQT